MRSRFLSAGWRFAAAACLLSGCSGKSSRPATSPVRGTVTYQGQPVAGASLAFLASGAPDFAVGTTDDAGRFVLTTFKPNDGAVVGTHTVTVKKPSTSPDAMLAPVAPGGDAAVDPQSIEQAMQQSAQEVIKAKKSASLLPAKYADLKTTDLRVEVAAGENVVELKLVD